MNGFLNALKPPGMSSHDMVNAVRRILNIKKAGHAGTLDPAAAGVLPIAVGRATRLLEYLSLSNKSYRGEILLGKSTVSGDLLGEITEICEVQFPSTEKILDTINSFKGKILQRPPIVSAIQINGKRAYDLARKGQDFEMPLREVEIFSIELLKTYPEKNSFLIDAEVSKGAYIRSLAVDIGEKLNVPALLKFLLRTRVGDFFIENAYSLEELGALGETAILKPDSYLSHIPSYELPENRRKAFLNGLSTGERRPQPNLLTVFCNNEFLGVARYKNGEVAPVKVYAT
ncbi:MAG: tRNA pseudouridine(55) synthase TruB [Selenomonadaceae bacterium]|nr:tRNA pseudouridine(55) synthase TruB [Selenomonadaceae bacterium]